MELVKCILTELMKPIIGFILGMFAMWLKLRKSINDLKKSELELKEVKIRVNKLEAEKQVEEKIKNKEDDIFNWEKNLIIQRHKKPKYEMAFSLKALNDRHPEATGKMLLNVFRRILEDEEVISLCKGYDPRTKELVYMGSIEGDTDAT